MCTLTDLVQGRDAVDVLGRVDGLPVLLVVDGLHFAVDGGRVNLLDVVLEWIGMFFCSVIRCPRFKEHVTYGTFYQLDLW